MKNVLLCLLLLISSNIIAQNHEPVLSNLQDQSLLNALVANYKPNTVADYSNARDLMYGTIDKRNDSVYCVYSGHRLFLPNGVDPSDYIFQSGSTNGINAEHTYPQSKGAEFGNAKSDMHHLFPTRVQVNSDRGSLQFREIPDNQTDKWYINNQTYSNIPSSNIDAYSEGTNSGFEPKEDHKGDVARAMFYFYTMYKQQADAADPSFFQNQLSTLCEWHYLDPVDQKEWDRTHAIAQYQSGKRNPFVLDCSLAARAYCGLDGVEDCNITPATSIEETAASGINIYPNPTYDQLKIVQKTSVQNLIFELYSIDGQLVKRIILDAAHQTINVQNMPNHMYFYMLKTKEGAIIKKDKLVILR